MPDSPADAPQQQIDPQNVDYHEIARRGDTEVMTAFLDAGLDPDLTNARGHSLLMIAAYNQQPAMVELLVEQGADVGRPDTSGSSPLMGCAFQGFGRVAELLLNRGADVAHVNGAGATALMFAAMYKQPTLVACCSTTAPTRSAKTTRAAPPSTWPRSTATSRSPGVCRRRAPLRRRAERRARYLTRRPAPALRARRRAGPKSAFPSRRAPRQRASRPTLRRKSA